MDIDQRWFAMSYFFILLVRLVNTNGLNLHAEVCEFLCTFVIANNSSSWFHVTRTHSHDSIDQRSLCKCNFLTTIHFKNKWWCAYLAVQFWTWNEGLLTKNKATSDKTSMYQENTYFPLAITFTEFKSKVLREGSIDHFARLFIGDFCLFPS